MNRPRQYELLVAQNFLRNISLDGTHHDTALRIFDQRGIDHLPCWTSKSSRGGKQVTFESLVADDDDENILNELVPLPPPPHINIDSSMLPLGPDQRTAGSMASDVSAARTRASPRRELSDKTGAIGKKKRRKWSLQLKEMALAEDTRLAQITKRIGLAKYISYSSASDRLVKFGSPAGTVESVANASVMSNVSRGELKFVWNLKHLGSSRNERVCFVSPDSNAPLAVFSVVRYGKRALGFERVRHQSSSSSETTGLRPFELVENQEMSYSHLLVPYRLRVCRTSPGRLAPPPRRGFSEDPETWLLRPTAHSLSTSRASSCEPKHEEHQGEDEHYLARSYPLAEGSSTIVYDPSVFDNPEFGPGHHTTTLKFAGYMTSIIDYVDKDEMKKEINEKFRHRFPNIQLTFSKFKSVKREMRKIGLECDIDPVTLAHAYVYLEKIVLKALINKPNRKLVAGACLLLAAKMNDVRAQQLAGLVEKIESTLRVNRKELMPYELPIAVALDFNLQPPEWELLPHYQKIIWTA